MASAITPRDELGDLPNHGKASNRGTRPWLGPVHIAELHLSRHPQAAYLNTSKS